MQLPHTRTANWPTDLASSKLASQIRSTPDGCRIGLIGVPDDTGVKLNYGRPGAAHGPDALRSAFARYGVADPHDWTWPSIWDAGDVEVVPGDLHATHERVTSVVRSMTERGVFPIMIGGGHDLTFPFVRAVAELQSPMHGIYFDAHLDVRAETGSGMPFRRLIETGAADSLRVFGLDPFSNAREHVEWFNDHGGRIGGRTPDDEWLNQPTFVSLDMDVFDSAHAPGVSALNPCGWQPALGERWCYEAGRNNNVRCFDIMELSPPFDQDGRTARLAARMLLAFIRGYSERSA
jgi:arginase family enzyme